MTETILSEKKHWGLPNFQPFSPLLSLEKPWQSFPATRTPRQNQGAKCILPDSQQPAGAVEV